MHILRTIATPALVLSLLGSASSTQAQRKPSPDNTELAGASDVGRSAQEALVEADSTGLAGLKLKKAVLTIETGTAVEGGGELNFIIFTVSSKASKGSTQTTTMTFERLPRRAGAGIRKVDDLREPLARTIATAAAIAAEVKVLPFSEATIKIDFVVEKKGGGGISFKILGATVGGNVDLSKTSKNSLEVTFER